MGKSKKQPEKKGGSKKAVKAVTKTPVDDAQGDINPGVIGLGMPVSEEEMRELKEKARKLDK